MKYKAICLVPMSFEIEVSGPEEFVRSVVKGEMYKHYTKYMIPGPDSSHKGLIEPMLRSLHPIEDSPMDELVSPGS